MKTKKRIKYAVVGVSHRAYSMFLDQIVKQYKNYAELVAMLDPDAGRMERYCASRGVEVAQYAPENFDRMVAEARPDRIVVACQDVYHDTYVIKALEHGLDVIVEKPLTTTVHKCAAIMQAARASKGRVIVTFNYRYTPHTTKIREIVAQGKIGRVVSVDLNWSVDTYHGASYFQRWNRQREMSGGLSVHKSCHHLDLVQWWINQRPVEVFAYGGRTFFGPHGVHNPLQPEQVGDGRTCLNCDEARRCRYYMRWYRNEMRNGIGNPNLDEFVSEARIYKNYTNRQCIYDPAIDIEDQYSALIRYDQGAVLNYSVIFSAPYEGFNLTVNGTEGRVEFKEWHARLRLPFSEREIDQSITYIPLFGGREKIETINLGGGHGGGDPLLLDELFIGRDELCDIHRQADLEESIDVVLTGIAIHKSITGHTAINMNALRTQAGIPQTVA